MEELIYKNDKGEQVVFSTRSIFHVNIKKDVDGLGELEIDTNLSDSIDQDGSSFLSVKIDPRYIQIYGHINEKRYAREFAHNLLKVINPKFNGTLEYKNGDFKRVIDCRLDKNIKIIEKDIFTSFTINLVCPYPYFRDENKTRTDIATWIADFEFECEFAETGVELGHRQPSLIINVENKGDVEAPLQIDFYATGTVENPSLINVNTQEFIKLNSLKMQSGDIVSITTHYGNKKILLIRNGVQEDVSSFLDDESSFLMLENKDNLFRYNADLNVDNLEVFIYHTNYYYYPFKGE